MLSASFSRSRLQGKPMELSSAEERARFGIPLRLKTQDGQTSQIATLLYNDARGYVILCI
jgi:hypothetical protein